MEVRVYQVVQKHKLLVPFYSVIDFVCLRFLILACALVELYFVVISDSLWLSLRKPNGLSLAKYLLLYLCVQIYSVDSSHWKDTLALKSFQSRMKDSFVQVKDFQYQSSHVEYRKAWQSSRAECSITLGNRSRSIQVDRHTFLHHL